MGYQAVFKRYELKYMVTAEQKDRILRAMAPYMEPDRFARSTVRNIYYDTDDFILARRSIAKPDYKEKLRVRSYAQADDGSTVFVELKRKFDGVVYKRRIGLAEADAMKWMAGAGDPRAAHGTGYERMTGAKDQEVTRGTCSERMTGAEDQEVTRGTCSESSQGARRTGSESSQVADEIEYFTALYGGLKPVLYLSYYREAYRMKKGASVMDGGDAFRVTFDSDIRCRETDLSLRSEAGGKPLLEEGKFLMELKCPGAIPLWMTKVLSEEKIYKTSFSKYGTAYCSFMEETPQQRAREIAEAGYSGWAEALNSRNKGMLIPSPASAFRHLRPYQAK